VLFSAVSGGVQGFFSSLPAVCGFEAEELSAGVSLAAGVVVSP